MAHLNGSVFNPENFDGERLVEDVPVELLHVAVADQQGVDLGLDLAQANSQRRNVGVGALDVDTILAALSADAGVQDPRVLGAVVLGRLVDPLAPGRSHQGTK